MSPGASWIVVRVRAAASTTSRSSTANSSSITGPFALDSLGESLFAPCGEVRPSDGTGPSGSGAISSIWARASGAAARREKVNEAMAAGVRIGGDRSPTRVTMARTLRRLRRSPS